MDQSRKFLIATIFALVLASCGTVQEATLVDDDTAESLAFASDANNDGSEEIGETDAVELDADAAERNPAAPGDEDDDDLDPSEDSGDDTDDEISSPPSLISNDLSDDDEDDAQEELDNRDTSSNISTSTSTPRSSATTTSTTAATRSTTAAPTTTTTAAPATTRPQVTTTTRPPTTTTRPPTTTTTTRPPATTTAAPTTTTTASSNGESAVEAAASNEIFRLVNCARTGSSDWCQPGDDANWNPAALANERPGTALTRSRTLNTTSVEWSKQLTQPGQPFAHSPRSGIDYGENVAWYGRSTSGPSITPHDAIEAAGNLMDQWMNSPGHRTNLLRSSYSTMGVGTAYDVEAQSFAIYGTQQFS